MWLNPTSAGSFFGLPIEYFREVAQSRDGRRSLGVRGVRRRRSEVPADRRDLSRLGGSRGVRGAVRGVRTPRGSPPGSGLADRLPRLQSDHGALAGALRAGRGLCALSRSLAREHPMRGAGGREHARSWGADRVRLDHRSEVADRELQAPGRRHALDHELADPLDLAHGRRR